MGGDNISGLIPVNDSVIPGSKGTVADTEITVHNVNPEFKTTDAYQAKKKEIAETLYRIFAKYD